MNSPAGNSFNSYRPPSQRVTNAQHATKDVKTTDVTGVTAGKAPRFFGQTIYFFLL
jgi:hypothetical protein